MVEYDQAVIETDMAAGQFEIIGGTARQLRFDEVLQIITPVAETSPQRKWKVYFIQQFAPRQQRIENLPGIAKLYLRAEN